MSRYDLLRDHPFFLPATLTIENQSFRDLDQEIPCQFSDLEADWLKPVMLWTLLVQHTGKLTELGRAGIVAGTRLVQWLLLAVV